MEKVYATTAIWFVLSTNIDGSSYPSTVQPVRLYPRAYGPIARMQILFLNLAINLAEPSYYTPRRYKFHLVFAQTKSTDF